MKRIRDNTRRISGNFRNGAVCFAWPRGFPCSGFPEFRALFNQADYGFFYKILRTFSDYSFLNFTVFYNKNRRHSKDIVLACHSISPPIDSELEVHLVYEPLQR